MLTDLYEFTMAHSFVTSFEEEIKAFRTFARTFGDRTVLLIDTYDTLVGAEKALVVAKELAARNRRLRGVRLDSGDMVEMSRKVRELFHREGLAYVDIFASGGFDEFKIDKASGMEPKSMPTGSVPKWAFRPIARTRTSLTNSSSLTADR
jgi:nicotinic acid phosphoribosyltransferase